MALERPQVGLLHRRCHCHRLQREPADQLDRSPCELPRLFGHVEPGANLLHLDLRIGHEVVLGELLQPAALLLLQLLERVGHRVGDRGTARRGVDSGRGSGTGNQDPPVLGPPLVRLRLELRRAILNRAVVPLELVYLIKVPSNHGAADRVERTELAGESIEDREERHRRGPIPPKGQLVHRHCHRQVLAVLHHWPAALGVNTVDRGQVPIELREKAGALAAMAVENLVIRKMLD